MGSLRALSGLPRTFQLVWDAHPALSIAMALLNAVQALVPVSLAWLTKLVIDLAGVAVAGGSVTAEEVWRLAIVGAVISLIATAIDPTTTYVQIQLGDYLKKEIQLRILAKANSLADVSYFEDPVFYDRLRRAQGDSVNRPFNVMNGSVQIFRALVHLVSMLAVLLVFQPGLVLVAVALAIPGLVQQFRSQVEHWEITNASIPEVRRMRYFAGLITGKGAAGELRLYDLGAYFLRRFEHELATFHARMRTMRRRQMGWEASTSALAELGSSAMYAWLVFQTLARRITLGDWSLLSQAVWQANTQIRELARLTSGMHADLLFVGQLFEFLETPPAMQVPSAGEGTLTPRPLQAGIEFRDVTFRYPGNERAVLEGLSLRVLPGESVALVGENGAGKTTIVKLMTRLYDPTEGQILIDGVDLREMDLPDWRGQSAAIFQDYTRYHLTARENVGLGDVTRIRDLASVASAAGRGGAAGVVEKLPEGYETVLGLWLFNANNKKIEEGTELSGGEWQKVALSRGFMRSDDDAAGSSGAQLLVLDEPTASLDTQSEYDVYRRFHELTRGKATLLISHRFSTVRMADRIVVLDEGRIKELGSHAELMQLGGTYADLYEKQAARYR